MKNKQIEQRLKQALEHAAPCDIDAIFSRCDEEKGTVIPMTIKKKKMGMAALIIAACFILVVIGGGIGIGHRQANSVASVIMLDVNPSIELKVNQEERVLEALPLNDDAQAILNGMDLKNTQLEVAVNAIMGSLLKNGYIDELANSILLTVEDSDPDRASQLQSSLTQMINAVMESSTINGAILSQTVEQNQQLQQKADQYGISLGKARLIDQLISKNPSLTFDSLAGRTVNELNLLASNENIQLSTVNSIGSASDSAYIGSEAAVSAALSHAGIDASQATVTKIDFDLEDGRMVYEVEFWLGSVEYEYDVDATSGKIVKNERKDRTQADSGQPSGDIGANAARDTALSRAGLSIQDVSGLTVKPDYEDGRMVYEVEFWKGSTEYQYQVSAAEGKIMKEEIEPHNTAGQPGTGQGDIGEEAAQAAALSHAGKSSDQVTGMRVKLDWEDGERVYDIEFWVQSTEYEYEVGSDGSIRKAEQKGHASAGSSGQAIGRDAALQAALSHAGVSQSDIYDLKIEQEMDDRTPHYEIEFKSGNMEYDYEVDAGNGNILKFDREQDD